MAVATLEGIVKDGQILVSDKVALPEGARVFVVVPDDGWLRRERVHSPRLAHREQAGDFVKQVADIEP